MRPEGETKSAKPPNCSPAGQHFCYHTEHFSIRTFFFAFHVFYVFKCKFLDFFLETHPNSLDQHSKHCNTVQQIQLPFPLLLALRACFPPHLSSSFPPTDNTQRSCPTCRRTQPQHHSWRIRGGGAGLLPGSLWQPCSVAQCSAAPTLAVIPNMIPIP